jgi:molecular chaperone HtpG
MGQDVPDTKAKLEINPRHPLIKQLAAIQDSQRELAGKVAKQLTDHALLAAGMDVNPGEVSEGMTELLSELLESRAGQAREEE